MSVKPSPCHRPIGFEPLAARQDGLEKSYRVRDLLEEPVPNYAWENDLAGDTSKIRRELGYADVVGFEEGLRRTIEWEGQRVAE